MNDKQLGSLSELTQQSLDHLVKRLYAQAQDGDPIVRDFALSLLSDLETSSSPQSSSTLYRYMTDPCEDNWSLESKLALKLPKEVPFQDPADNYLRLVLIKHMDRDAADALCEMASGFFEVLTVFKETYETEGTLIFLTKATPAFAPTLQHFHAAIEGDLMTQALVLASPCGCGLVSLNRLYKTLQAMCSHYSSKDQPTDSLAATFESLLPSLIAHSLNNAFKANLQDTFKKGFDAGLDGDELHRTAEQFLKNNLNITDTAKALFIHRNTLVYRLEKIQRETGFDLRHFDDSWTYRLILAGRLK